jgi:DNA-binding GntR family transcriptional regulator
LSDRLEKLIDTPSLVEVVREHLIEDIMERRYLPGQKLPVVAVASRYGVSETPVKQAFNRLVSEGMLEAVPRRGVIVRRVTKEAVQELMEARQMVNLVAVDASIDCPPEDRTLMQPKLEEKLDEHRRLIEGVTDKLSIEVYLHYVEIDREYHMTYLRCAHNRTIERFYQQLYNQAYAYVSLSTLMTDRIRLALAQHRSIFDAWLKKDRAAMTEALKQHKQSAIDALYQIYDKERQ